MEFARDPGALVLPGFRSPNRETLQAELDHAGLEGLWVAADLSLGAWRGHQVAREFAAQLAVEFPSVGGPVAGNWAGDRKIEIAYADSVGEFIDAEARGDRATITSLQYASQLRDVVLEGAPRVFLVVAPRYGMPWEPENVLFIRLLAQALKETRSVVALVAASDSDPEVPTDWTVAWCGDAPASRNAAAGDGIVGLVPGMIDRALAETLRDAGLPEVENLVPLASGHWLVPFEWRRPPAAVSRLDFDRFGDHVRSHGWLDAYAQYYGNKMYVEPWFLYAEGQRRFVEGGTGITLRLMERALAQVCVGPEWGILQAYAQGLRVASHRFTEAAGVMDPPESLPADLRSFLLQSKGWGLVMTDDLARAEECFARARDLSAPESRDRREYLYLLNISALCRLKQGQFDEALALEHEIEERRQRLSPPDWRLHYVNSINIARLQRRRGDLEKAEQYFSDAFATTLGARSESDAVHVNVILARLRTACGRHAEAFACWMRAGLHWAASDVPEAMGGRIVRHILGRGLEPTASMAESVAASLCESILSAAADSGLPEVLRRLPDLSFGRDQAPAFVRAEIARRTLPHAVADRAVLSVSLSVLGMHDTMEPHIRGQHSTRLRVLLYDLLEALAPPDFLAEVGAIIVDDSLGREMAATPEELVADCVRLGVTNVAIKGKVALLTADDRAEVERSLRVQVGCAVAGVALDAGRAQVFFKRYLPPILLTAEETRLLAFVDEGPTVDDIVQCCEKADLSEGVLFMLRRLEQKRVVNMDLVEP